MSFTTKWSFKPAPWTAFADQEVLDKVMLMDLNKEQGKKYENPEFELKVVYDCRNYYAIDIFQRIRMSDVKNEKIVMVFSSPEVPVYMSAVENLNKYGVSCRNVEVFFFDEYANKKGEVAPWQSPYSRSGQWMKYFYQRLNAELRMPMEQIHFWTAENADSYSELLASYGGADVLYTSFSWNGLRCIDAESFPAKDMAEFEAMGSRIVTPSMEQQCMDSLRGMFGCSGDISNVPPCTATLGPKDLKAAKTVQCFNFLSSCNGLNNLQSPGIRLAMFGPICPTNPGSLLRKLPGVCYLSVQVAQQIAYPVDLDWLPEKIGAIRKAEGGR